jgi:hypothetical protein
MKLVKFDNTYYDAFVTTKDVTVDLVLNYLTDNYASVGTFIPDPDNEYFSCLNCVYDKENNSFIHFKEYYIEER